MTPDASRLERLLRALGEQQLLVAGDVMLDEYLWGDAQRLSPEAPVPVVRIAREGAALGGAGNVARGAVALGARVHFCGVVGEDEAGARVAALLRALPVSDESLVRAPGRPTTRKTRVGARAQQMLRFDRESDAPLPAAAHARLLTVTERAVNSMGGTGGVVLSDYGKGALTTEFLNAATPHFQRAGLMVAVDPKQALAPHAHASFVKPNLHEMEAFTQLRIRSDEDLARAAAKVQTQLPGVTVVVTRGAGGMTVFEPGAPALRAPSARHEVFDVQGAGDTAIAVLALARLAGARWAEAAILANAAAAVVIGKLGTATATQDEIAALLPEALRAFEAAAGERA